MCKVLITSVRPAATSMELAPVTSPLARNCVKRLDDSMLLRPGPQSKGSQTRLPLRTIASPILKVDPPFASNLTMVLAGPWTSGTSLILINSARSCSPSSFAARRGLDEQVHRVVAERSKDIGLFLVALAEHPGELLAKCIRRGRLEHGRDG